MKITHFATVCVAAAILSACQTSQTAPTTTGIGPAGVASCGEARVRQQALMAEHEQFNRQIVRNSGRRAVRASVDAGLPPDQAARRAEVIQELAALDRFDEQNRCGLQKARRN